MPLTRAAAPLSTMVAADVVRRRQSYRCGNRNARVVKFADTVISVPALVGWSGPVIDPMDGGKLVTVVRTDAVPAPPSSSRTVTCAV